MSSQSPGLPDDTWRATKPYWTILIWLLAALSLAVAWGAGQALPVAAGLSLPAAAIASAATAWWREGFGRRLAIALCLVSVASVLVSGLWGTRWAAGGDVVYAAVLALLAADRDWRVLPVAAAAAVAQRAGLALMLSPVPSDMAALAMSRA